MRDDLSSQGPRIPPLRRMVSGNESTRVSERLNPLYRHYSVTKSHQRYLPHPRGPAVGNPHPIAIAQSRFHRNSAHNGHPPPRLWLAHDISISHIKSTTVSQPAERSPRRHHLARTTVFEPQGIGTGPVSALLFTTAALLSVGASTRLQTASRR